jgi:hypothetical protein
MGLPYFARKYIWWQSPEAAIADRHRVIAQVMNYDPIHARPTTINAPVYSASHWQTAQR